MFCRLQSDIREVTLLGLPFSVMISLTCQMSITSVCHSFILAWSHGVSSKLARKLNKSTFNRPTWISVIVNTYIVLKLVCLAITLRNLLCQSV